MSLTDSFPVRFKIEEVLILPKQYEPDGPRPCDRVDDELPYAFSELFLGLLVQLEPDGNFLGGGMEYYHTESGLIEQCAYYLFYEI